MRVLAVDHGQARIGLAISDAGGRVARPLQALAHVERAADAARVAQLAAEHAAECIVLGLPKDSDGNIGPAARRVQRFGAVLAEHTAIPVTYWDESNTTKRAAELSGRKRTARPALDAIAAAIILQDYWDAHAHDAHPIAP